MRPTIQRSALREKMRMTNKRSGSGRTHRGFIRSFGTGSAGFTLVELLVVIAIVIILLALLFPFIGSARERAITVKCMSRQRQITAACFVYAGAHEGELPYFNWYGSHSTFNVNHWPYWFFIDNQGWENLGHLWNERYIEDPRVFFCPAFDGGNVPPAYLPWPNNVTCPGCANGVRLTYDFNPEKGTDGVRDHVRTSTLSADVLLLGDSIYGAPRHQGGWVITRGDGSVSRVVSQEAWDVIVAAGPGIHHQDFVSYDRVLDLLMGRSETTP